MRAAFVWAALLVLCQGSLNAAVHATDDRGVRILLPQPAGRIVSLSPHATELLYAAGAGQRVIAVAAYSDYPPTAAGLPVIGDASRLDIERILALRPDLVVGWLSGNAAVEVARLERLGIRVYLTEARQLHDIARHMLDIGRLAGTEAIARRAAQHYTQTLARLQREYAGRAPVAAFYQVWPRPLTTVGGTHIISEVLRTCGGRNVFENLRPLAPTVSVESALRADPEVIIAGDEKGAGDLLGAWRRWPQLRAVRSGRLYRVSADHLHRPTPRLLEGARAVCERLEEARSAPSGYASDRRSSLRRGESTKYERR